MRLFSHKQRPVHMGSYPAELLPRLNGSSAPHPYREQALDARPVKQATDECSVAPSIESYAARLRERRDGPVAARAPIPESLVERARHIKASAYFLDASLVGIARLEAEGTPHPLGTSAVVISVACAVEPASGQPGAEWLRGTNQARAALRAAEIAVITAGYLRNLGHATKAHMVGATGVSLHGLAESCGLADVTGDGNSHAFFPNGFALAAVTTELDMEPDLPLRPRSLLDMLRIAPQWWFGTTGAEPGWAWLGGRTRPMHLGWYPMEKIRRVPKTTTRITDQVPRVPQRANFFVRARFGDLGAKFQADVQRFAYKTPSAQAYISSIASMVPHQDGPVAAAKAVGTDDAAKNADALKSLAYSLGGDMAGVCAVPDYAWYSHRVSGEAIAPYHSHALVVLIDQGFETMEGASGDDWISGAQSMRAYMRGAQIAGVIAHHIRRLGYSARSQTNADSDVLQLPLVLLAGLGELSRIGELVLNPFVGPRFKSVVVTTNLPLQPDQPIDFGLQDFCNKCLKCARECPCSAIPFGPKVMFNGYEIWKPDVEKCAKYRIGNPMGSACGRCMKTCPFNTEGLMSHRLALWAAMKFPFLRKKLADWDDVLMNGSINPVKKWWWDLEWVDGRAVKPLKGTNARGLDVTRIERAKTQELAMYPAPVMPPPDSTAPVLLERKPGVAAYREAEAQGIPQD